MQLHAIQSFYHSRPSSIKRICASQICNVVQRPKRRCMAVLLEPSSLQQQYPIAYGVAPLAAVVTCKRVLCRAIDSSTQQVPEEVQQGPDLQFVHPTSGVQVFVFGVEHLGHEPHIGEWILANRPAAVVVETACTPDHGAQPGVAITCRDQVPGADGMFLRIFCQIAAALQEQGDAARAPGGIWEQAAGQFNGEQLAYIAAFATGAQLLFGDRPKEITYRRLSVVPTLEDLDVAFSAEVAAGYSARLTQLVQPDEQLQDQQYEQWQHYQQALSETAVWDILMREREAVMLGVVDQVCSKGLLLLPDMPKPSVALVVGSAHLQGLLQLLQSGSWQSMIGEEGLSSSSPIMQAPAISAEDLQQPDAGAKRALLEAVLQLSMPDEVLQDMQDVLPAITDPQQAAAHDWTLEIYSSYRMQLASLPDKLLGQVCSAAQKGASLQPVLQPVQQLKPVCGGPGWDAEVGQALRLLNFQVGAGQSCAELEE